MLGNHFHKLILLVTLAALTVVISCRRIQDPPLPDDSNPFAACVIPGTDNTLDIVSFNVQGFPKEGYLSITTLADLLEAMDPDVVALQEVASEAEFNRLVELMPGWSGVFYPINNAEWNLAYLIRVSELETVAGSLRTLFEGDHYAFPRPPMEIMVRHRKSGREIILINLHLKCCEGEDNENRRRSASEKLKEYLDQQRPDDAVVMLGDYNDEIASGSATVNPFLNFINDDSSYRFADMEIALGSKLWWSYPSWPSHIDHILVTDELFESIDTTMVIKASTCYPDYEVVISDHRPLMIVLTP
ncbi:MAG TPA: endonuclease/exonuclease/phosphatase family protein [Bacteroidales bacterium]|nr:endonuclease/exonuclease/phosphatase family protein [Bacteroidales bacterium]